MSGAVRTASSYKARPVAGSAEPAQRDVVLSFVGSQAKVQKSGMILPQNLSERSWEQIGTNLRELANSSVWWLADWMNYGEATYGWRRYKEAIERTGLDYQTLRNYSWVARRFEHHRRRDSLSFAHHAEVARLAPPEQEYWLRKAEQQKWSRNELRRSVRASLAVQSDKAELTAGGDEQQDVPRLADSAAAHKRQQKVAKLTIELPAGRLEYLAKTAAANGLPLDQWVARVLEAAERGTAGQPEAADRKTA
ncbi:LmbU family transcriptional regulator [Streptomyces sp. NBC_00239]|uniref:LmbU family transcriptional regulator n=1 Tax=Streptomyces sp. NBC_00239 TaxID=2903640 RepID=UPI002E2DAA63|nr:LmbU family transcriptional regulator [Streptomyces sp. NBC_00239]